MAVTSFEWGVSFQVATLCIILVKVTLAYNISCPRAGHWNLRAKVLCSVTDKYYCLYNPVSELFVEGCNKPVFEGSGSEVRFPDNFNREPCSKNRFQPIKYWTNGSSECIFEKSKCSEEGQVSCNNGKADTDRECRCYYTKGFGHVISPANTCGCLPTKEDCSCYRQTCQDLGMVLTADNECATRTSAACEPITNVSCVWMTGYTKAFLTPQTVLNTTDQQQKQYITQVSIVSRHNRYTASVLVLVLSCFMLVGIVWGICRILKSTDTEQLDGPKETGINLVHHNQSTIQEKPAENIAHVCNISKASHVSADGLLEEERNFLRIICLLYRVACPVVRLAFNKEIHSDRLYTTIAKNKKQINEILLNENRIDKLQWKFINPKPGYHYTSSDFDIRFMTLLLETLVPEVDMRYQKALSKIKDYQNELTQTTTGTLSDDEFKECWDNIGRTILRIVGVNLEAFEKTEHQELLRIKEAVLSLNPVEIRNKNFYCLIRQMDSFSSQILLQIIEEYCRSAGVTVNDFIRSQKHNLFHKRLDTISCCNKRCGHKQKPFVRVLRESDWQKMFTKCKGDKDHMEHAYNSCCERFKLQDIILYDRELACCLILYSPEISEYIISLLYPNGKLKRFLNLYKPELCKTSHLKTMADTSTVIDKNELKTLYIKNEKSSCNSKCSCRNFKETEKCFCCCKYRARSGLTVDSIEENILSKIISLVGTVSVVYLTRDTLFRNFTGGILDDIMILTLLDRLTNAHKKLISIIKDHNVRQILNKGLEDLENRSVPDDEVTRTIEDWISAQRQASDDKHLVKVMIKDKYTKDPKQLYSWQSWMNLKLHGKRHFSCVKKEENNFLKIVHLMNVAACSALREKFKKDIWEKTENQDLFCKIISHATRSFRKPGDAYLTKYNLKVIFQQPVEKLSPNHFDLKLLITLLRLSAECAIDKATNGHHPLLRTSKDDLSACELFKTGKNEMQSEEAKLDPDVKAIDYYRRKIVHSSTGILSDADFDHYWDKISQAAIQLGGPDIKRKCKQLTAEKNKILRL